MDIIKHGKYHDNIYEIKCHNCGCVFAYAENDRHGYDTIPSLANKFVTCPECNKWLQHKYRIRKLKV